MSFIDCVRNQWSQISRRDWLNVHNVHLPSFRSLWPRQNNSRDSIPISTRSPVITSVHRMPHEARQSDITADTTPVTNQSGRDFPLSSEPHRSNAGTTIPLATQHPQLIFTRDRIYVPVQTPQQHAMTTMRYMPSSSTATAGVPQVPVTNLQSQIMAHVMHEPRRSQPIMIPLQHGSQTNARAHHTPQRTLLTYLEDSHQSQRMAPEPREEPNRPSSDINAYISASVYRRYENDKNTECAVCLGDLKRGEMVMRMPLCCHVYHEKCICQWLLQKPSCPLCRSPIRAQLSVRVGD